ncbi:MAG TPA: hypothetical protein VMM56_16370, partial [Planctomycetaceae bacterium]|nr:hypothetical protein [Planctomycetaceae bacterium]
PTQHSGPTRSRKYSERIMSRRRTNSNSVSLFPFLAVLLCAMGSLLFLLIVATRMIRDEAVQKYAIASHSLSDPQSVEFPAGPEDSISSVPTEQDILLGVAAQFPEASRPEPRPLTAPKPKIIIHEPEPLPDLSVRIAKLRAEQKSFEVARQAREADLEKQKTFEARRTALQTELELRRQVLTKADAALLEMKQSLDKNSVKLPALQSRQRELEATARQLTEKLKISQTQPRSVSNPLKIVPYDGNGGTTRRPLILECRANSIVFQPEGVELTERDLLGFTTAVNPVLAGVRVLDRYWTVHDGQRATARRPYVLIVVRPDGIAAYYALRQLLSEYDQPFGYELLGDDQTLALEAADSQASQILSASVEQLLARRAEFATSGKSAFALPEQRGSNSPPEKTLATNESQTLEAVPRGDSTRPRFRMTPRGLEVIAPDEEPEESLFPSPPRSAAPSSASNDNRAGNPRTAPSNPPVPLESLGEIQSVEIPQPADANRQNSATARKQDPQLDFPELLEPEPDIGDRNSTTSQAPLLPTNPLLSNTGTSSSAQTGKGPAQPILSDGKIRFQRELTVVLGPSELRVGYGEPIPIAEGISTRELLTLVVNQLRDETTAWGPPPAHLTWKPVVRFVLQPGGLQHYERIHPYFERHKLIDSVSFELAESGLTPNS